MQRATAPTFGDRGISPMVRNPVVARRPVATYGLIAANLAVFVVCVLQIRSADVSMAPLTMDWSLINPYVADGQWWRLLTAGFIHFSVIHIAVNMISLYLLGRDLEMALGIPRYLLLYFTSLLGGSAAVMLFGSDDVRTGGASGAIYGLMGAMLVVVLRAKVSPTPVITIIVFNLVFSFSVPGISILAHVGGLLFGAAAAAAVLFAPQYVLSQDKRTPQAVSKVGWIGLTALFVLSIALSVGAALVG